MEKLFFLISQIFYSYIIYKGMRALAGRRKINKWLEMGSYLLYSFVTTMVYQIWNIPVLTLFSNIVLLFLITFMYESKMSSRFIQVFSICALLSAGETLAMVLLNQTVMEQVNGNMEEVSTMVVVVGRMIQLLIVVCLEKFLKRKEQKKFSGFQVIVMAVVTVGSVYLEIISFLELYQKHLELVVITNIVILLLNIIIVWIFDVLGNQYLELEKNHLLEIKNVAYENQLRIMKENEASIQLLRHDMKNHSLVLKELLAKKQIEEAKEHLDKMLETIKGEGIWIRTGNQEIDSFVNFKFTEAQQWKIECLTEAKIPENLKLNGFSMACILGNLLDNAIAAARACESPKITLKLFYLKQNLYIELENTYNGKLTYKGSHLVTQKSNPKLHGFGLKSVSKEVERCKGTLTIKHNDKKFVATVMLPIVSHEEKVNE